MLELREGNYGRLLISVTEAISRAQRFFKPTALVAAIFISFLSPRWWIVDAGSDDLLYVRQATYLLHGQWLGPMQYGAALKLPGFPLFLAIASILHITFFSLIILLQGLFANKISNRFRLSGYSLAHSNLVFMLILFAPPLFGFSNSRVIRDGFYCVLLTGFIAYMGEVFITLKHKKKISNSFYKDLVILLVLVTWIYHTREESIIILALIIFSIVLIYIFLKEISRKKKLQFLSAILVLELFFVLGSDFLIKKTNQHYYGVNSSALLQSGELSSLVNEWSRVNPVSKNPRVSISAAQRQIIYREIPTIKAYSNAIEGYASGYQEVSCGMAKVCSEVGSGWIAWALYYAYQSQTAIDAKGNFSVAKLDLMTKEIRKYCAKKLQNCDDSLRVYGIGKISNLISIVKILPLEFMGSFLLPGTFQPTGLSYGSQENAELFRQLIPWYGPPNDWPNSPIGVPGLPIYILIFLVLSTVFLLTRETENVSNQLEKSVLYLYISILVGALILRAFVTATLKVNVLDPNGTNYLMPSASLAWTLLVLIAFAGIPSSKILIKRREGQ